MRSDNLIEYIGRNDFQVKIRGFRIEPGEVENALNQIPSVEESVVIVHEDENGGQQLAAFLSGNRIPKEAFIRKSLRSQLPDYMIPSKIIHLEALPRSSSGKIDRSELKDLIPSYSETNGSHNVDTSSLESVLLSLWRRLLQRPDIQPTDNFFDIGGHSLLAARLFVEIEKETGKTLPISTLYRAPTISGLIHYLEENTEDRSWSTLVPIRKSGKKTPLICVTPWDGNAIYFRSLPKYLDADQPIYSLEPLGPDGASKQFDSLEQLIETYQEDLQTQIPDGPISLCGFSGGGVIALEIARMLKDRGRSVEGLYFFDTSFPGYHPTQSNGATSAEMRKMKLSAHMKAIKERKGWERFRYLMETLAIKIRFHFVKPTAEESKALKEEQRNMQENRKHFRLYSIAPYNGKVTLFKALDRRLETIIDPTMGWKKHAQCDVEIIEVPGGHNTMLLEPNDRILCEKLQQSLNKNTQ